MFDSRALALFVLVPREVGGIAPGEADKIRTSDRVSVLVGLKEPRRGQGMISKRPMVELG